MRRLLLILSTVLFCRFAASGQDYMKDLTRSEIQSRIEGYINEMTFIGANLSNARTDQLKIANRSINVLDAKWMNFFDKSIASISADEELLKLAADYEQARSDTQDSINVRQLRLEKTVVFVKSENLIAAKAPAYDDLEKKAFKLSLVKQAADELETLKAREQLDFADISKAYNDAKEASSINPALTQRMAALQAKYIAIEKSSSKIQQMEFQPFVARIKDYLMSLAAVSIIMMFFIFIGNYVKTLKTAKESAKKMEEILHKNDHEIPTI